MRCVTAQKWFLLFIDGELPQRRARRVASHLAKCSTCARQAELIREAWQLAVPPPVLQPSARLWWQIRAKTLAAAPRRPTASAQPRWAAALSTAGVVVLGIAAAILLSRVGFAPGDRSGSRPEFRLEAPSYRLVFEPLTPGSLPRLYAELADIGATGGGR
ncbi:MAG: zf-HC2 domain-containing protein [candidate division KSB1 bacterium]|nr:zf-HC2 domain-containing protein [candidate division KSB1 bacterium]